MSDQIEAVKLNITVQTSSGDYKIGDFVTALDEVFNYFANGPGGQDGIQLCDAMDMYSKHMRHTEE